MYATAVVGGKVVRFKLSPALARAHRQNRGKAMTEAEAVAFVEAKRGAHGRCGAPGLTLRVVLDTCILKLATFRPTVNASALIYELLSRTPKFSRTPDAPTQNSAGAMARVKASLLGRRFAALTRAMRSLKSGHLSERRTRAAIGSDAGVNDMLS
jgi:hypothetical protein